MPVIASLGRRILRTETAAIAAMSITAQMLDVKSLTIVDQPRLDDSIIHCCECATLANRAIMHPRYGIGVARICVR